MTLAAYQAAIEWSSTTGFPLGLECDVHFSADDQLICLHDLTVDRTSTVRGRAIDLTVEQLKRLNFGARGCYPDTPGERELVTLDDLLVMVQEARAAGVDVSLVIETKHPNPRAGEVEERVASMLAEFGWNRPGAPVRVISFSVEAVHRFRSLLPWVSRSFLIRRDLGPWRDGTLPEGVRMVGVDVRLLRQDPDFVARARRHHNKVNAWTVNDPEDIAFCLDLGVTGFTTDYPERVAEALAVGVGVRPGRG